MLTPVPKPADLSEVSKNLKNIGVVSLLTVVSRVLGLVRDQLGAAIIGTGLLNSAFLTAFRLPNLFRRLLGEGSLTAAFLPTLQEELHRHGRPGAYALLNKVTSWLVVVTGGLVVLTLLSASRLVTLGMAISVRFGWSGADADKWRLVADLTVVLFPYLAFVCVAAAFNAALNVFERFTEPALSPIWLNLSMIASLGGAGLLWAKTPMGQVQWLCAGVLVGGFLQMAVPAGVLIRLGWRPRFDLGLSPEILEIARLMAPGFLGTAVYQVNVYVVNLLAYEINESAATHIFYANRLMELPIGVFAIAVATVVYPLIARHAAERNYASMAADYRKGVRLVLLINVPAAAGLMLLSEPIVRVLFQHGKFGAADTASMAPLLALFAVGMPFFSVVSLTTRAFYALKDTTTPMQYGLASFVINLALSLVLMRRLGATGLVLASTVAIVAQTVLLQRALAGRGAGLEFAPLWRSLGKVALATVAMSAVVGLGWSDLHAVVGGRWADVAALGGLIPLGVAVYGATLWVLKIEGREELEALVHRAFRRRE